MKKVILLHLFVLLLNSLVHTQDFEPLTQEIGGTFCTFLAYKNQLPRKYFNLCPKPTCHGDTWSNTNTSTSVKTTTNIKKRVVVSYGHNGFGNQLWEHSVAFMIAESLHAQMLIAEIPDSLSPNGVIPPNTWDGMRTMERLLPDNFEYEKLPKNSETRTLCDNEPFYIADRPIDWRDKNYSANFRTNLYNLITDENPRCIKLVGYFQNLPLCVQDAKQLWTTKLLSNFTMSPGPNDISIYLRCVPRHYMFNDKHFYESILNHTVFERVWLFQAPECPKKLGDDPARDGMVAGVYRLLTEKYNATRWPSYVKVSEDDDPTNFLLHDLAGLMNSKKLILPVSSWAYWAGLLSNASEIHVNAPPHHSVMYGMPQYVYHDEKHKQFFGRYNAKENDIIYVPTERLSAMVAEQRGQTGIDSAAATAASAETSFKASHHSKHVKHVSHSGVEVSARSFLGAAIHGAAATTEITESATAVVSKPAADMAERTATTETASATATTAAATATEAVVPSVSLLSSALNTIWRRPAAVASPVTDTATATASTTASTTATSTATSTPAAPSTLTAPETTSTIAIGSSTATTAASTTSSSTEGSNPKPASRHKIIPPLVWAAKPPVESA